jgi:hypothetical protein
MRQAILAEQQAQTGLLHAIAAVLGARDVPALRAPLLFGPLGLRHIHDYLLLWRAGDDEQYDPEALWGEMTRGVE